MHDVAWRGMWICVRSKDAQKQLARTSLSDGVSGSLRFQNGTDNSAIVFASSPPTNCCVASVNPEFGATMARCLNQSRVSAVPQLNLITIKFGTAEARRLN